MEKLSIEELLTRKNLLVSKEVELAKSFRNTDDLELKILDYCFHNVPVCNSVVKALSVRLPKLLNYLELEKNKENIERVARAFKSLNENTVLYIPVEEEGDEGVMMTKVFDYIKYFETGVIRLKFSKHIDPYICDLKVNYPSFRISELANIRGKYTFKLLRLWELFRDRSKVTIIEGGLDEWQEWFLDGGDKLFAGQFMQNVLRRAIDEVESKIGFSITIKTHKEGRPVVGYRMEIIDARNSSVQRLDSKNSKENECDGIQTTIYDFLYENT